MLLDVLNNNFKHISEEYKQFAIEKDACKRCSIYNHYCHVGQSEGNAKNPSVMIIGEALGKDEVEQKRPFIGKAGQRLRQEIRKYPNFINPDNTIITNLLACRPPNNSFPTDSHGPWKADNKTIKRADQIIKFCGNNWLVKEIKMLKPKALLILGSQALKYVRNEFGITENRGTWRFLSHFKCLSFATYHPSYVLRCQNDDEKQDVVDDFEKDIEIFSKTWATTTMNDERLQMSDEELKQNLAKEYAESIGFNKYLTEDSNTPKKPLSVISPISLNWEIIDL